MGELLIDGGRKLVGVHAEGSCLLDNCAIHNPSEHPLNKASFEWIEQFKMLFRVCEHGFVHPDPDDMNFHMHMLDFLTVEAVASVHLMQENCDGCCRREEENK